MKINGEAVPADEAFPKHYRLNLESVILEFQWLYTRSAKSKSRNEAIKTSNELSV